MTAALTRVAATRTASMGCASGFGKLRCWSEGCEEFGAAMTFHLLLRVRTRECGFRSIIAGPSRPMRETRSNGAKATPERGTSKTPLVACLRQDTLFETIEFRIRGGLVPKRLSRRAFLLLSLRCRFHVTSDRRRMLEACLRRMPEPCLRHDTIGAFLRCRFTPRPIRAATIGALVAVDDCSVP